ncbi:MAG: PD40 domain-containing protein [Bacteroidetes bacterium]|nr:PD40 domain-containing protein [Bacteroidota bacterium]
MSRIKNSVWFNYLMGRMRRSCSWLPVFIFYYSSFGQNVEFSKDNFKDQKKLLKEALTELKTGDGYFEEERYLFALEHYQKANNFNQDNAHLNFKLGKCYLYTVQRSKSLPYLEKAYRLDPAVDRDITYLLAQSYHLNLNWDKAIEMYISYKENLTPSEYQKSAIIIDKKIKECNTGKELSKKRVRVFVDNNTELNSPYPEYGPWINADESVMYFTSRRQYGEEAMLDPVSGEYYEDIYISTMVNGKWTTPKRLPPPMNSEGHDATVCISNDGQTLLIYKDDAGDGNIYICRLKGNVWSKPKKMDKPVNSPAHESSATFSYDDKTLYFVSAREGGLGGRDIYVTRQNHKGKWDDARNLGPAVNTPYDEEGIFIHPDGKTLYFSSRGHNTMGGYDIFKTVFENGSWSKPENLGFPVNTPDDDVFFSISASGKHGYYASFKPDGLGDKDIYMITFLGPEKQPMLSSEDNLIASVAEPVTERAIEPAVEIQRVSLTLLKGIIRDAITRIAVEADIELADNIKKEVIASFKSNSSTGKYLVSLPAGKNYGIAVNAEGYLFHSENFDIPLSQGYSEVTKDIELKKVEVGSKIILKNIFFDFDKATLRPESTVELERLLALLTEVASMKIEISGHTDNKGSDDYNQKLSESRAKSVVDYLIGKGISTDRLTFKGYGEVAPIAANDNEEGRQMNRRTEFKIISK